MQYEEKAILPKAQIIAKLREVITALEGGEYVLGPHAIRMPEAAELEIEYKTKKGKEKLEMEIAWPRQTSLSKRSSDTPAAGASPSANDGKQREMPE